MADKDLEFIQTTRLIRELQRRLDHMVLMGSSNRTEDEDSVLFAAIGPAHCCLGLIEVGRLMVMAGGDDDASD
mgnify:CR=1 FL=1